MAITVEIADSQRVAATANTVRYWLQKVTVAIVKQQCDCIAGVTCDNQVWFPVTVKVANCEIYGVGNRRIVNGFRNSPITISR